MALTKDYTFESEHLRFRTIEKRDVETIVAWCGDPASHLNFLDPMLLKPKGYMAWYSRYLGDPTRYDFLIEDKDGNALGACGLSNMYGGSCEMSYAIGAMEARDKGYATETVQALTEVAFCELGVEHVDARILAHEEASSTSVAAGGNSLGVRESSGGTGTVLLLTNSGNTDGFRSWLEANEEDVAVVQDPIGERMAMRLAPAFVVSFNYRHIIGEVTIKALECPIINVHCSVLPWNRGASPNFFSYYENTPKGVTVHELTAELDKGDILLQSVLRLGEEETFATSYEKLIERATEMLIENWQNLRSGK